MIKRLVRFVIDQRVKPPDRGIGAPTDQVIIGAQHFGIIIAKPCRIGCLNCICCRLVPFCQRMGFDQQVNWSHGFGVKLACLLQ